MVFTLEYISVMHCFYLIACATSFGLNMFLVMTSMTKDIQNNFASVNKHVKNKMDHSAIVKQFRFTVHFHSAVKQLSSFIF